MTEDKTFVLVNTEIAAEKDVLSFLRKNASEYKMLGAFPVFGVYNIVGKFKGNHKEVYDNSVSDLRRRNKNVRETLTISTAGDSNFEKGEDTNLTRRSFCVINTEIRRESEALKDLDSIKGVTEAHVVYEVYDIVAKAEAKTSGDLKDLVDWKIRRIPAIRSTIELRILDGGFLVDDKGNITEYVVNKL